MPFDPSDPSPIHGLSDYAWPSNKQLAAIGSVVLSWSWLQLGVENLMATLAQSDEMLVQSLTEDLSPDNRLKALRRLISTWERIVPNLTDQHKQAFQVTREIVRWIAQNKAMRNNVAHWMWGRIDDDSLFGWKHNTMPRETEEGRPSQTMTVAEPVEFSRAIGDQEGRIAEADRILKTLPPWPPLISSRGIPPVPGLASLLSPYRRQAEP